MVGPRRVVHHEFRAQVCSSKLGNQLFQMAATIALALENGDSYGFPLWEHEQHFPNLKGCFYENILPGPEYKEPTFGYRPIPYRSSLRLSGFFQSEKHFAKHADRIRWLFTSKYLKGQVPRRRTACCSTSASRRSPTGCG